MLPFTTESLIKNRVLHLSAEKKSMLLQIETEHSASNCFIALLLNAIMSLLFLHSGNNQVRIVV